MGCFSKGTNTLGRFHPLDLTTCLSIPALWGLGFSMGLCRRGREYLVPPQLVWVLEVELVEVLYK